MYRVYGNMSKRVILLTESEEDFCTRTSLTLLNVLIVDYAKEHVLRLTED